MLTGERRVSGRAASARPPLSLRSLKIIIKSQTLFSSSPSRNNAFFPEEAAAENQGAVIRGSEQANVFSYCVLAVASILTFVAWHTI